jgi:hypothetical protein
MRVSRTSLLMIAVVLWSIPSAAQLAPRCLHGESETRVQQQRREDAVDGADLINQILARNRRDEAYPTWDALAKSPQVAAYRGRSGRFGDLARRIEWGTDQPLPGWSVHYVAGEDAYALSLTDTRDPCQLTVATNDTGLVIEGRPAALRGQMRVIPLDSSQ